MRTWKLAAALFVTMNGPVTADDLPAVPEPTSRERIKASRERFDSEMKLQTARPWDGTRPGRRDDREPDRSISAPVRKLQ
jgi:hypothetical protein